jgi:hypothetical protein
MTQHQKREQPLKGQGRNHTQINGSDRRRVVARECLPALRWRPSLHLVFRDRRLGDLKAQHQEFAAEAYAQLNIVQGFIPVGNSNGQYGDGSWPW